MAQEKCLKNVPKKKWFQKRNRKRSASKKTNWAMKVFWKMFLKRSVSKKKRNWKRSVSKKPKWPMKNVPKKEVFPKMKLEQKVFPKSQIGRWVRFLWGRKSLDKLANGDLLGKASRINCHRKTFTRKHEKDFCHFLSIFYPQLNQKWKVVISWCHHQWKVPTKWQQVIQCTLAFTVHIVHTMHCAHCVQLRTVQCTLCTEKKSRIMSKLKQKLIYSL